MRNIKRRRRRWSGRVVSGRGVGEGIKDGRRRAGCARAAIRPPRRPFARRTETTIASFLARSAAARARSARPPPRLFLAASTAGEPF